MEKVAQTGSNVQMSQYNWETGETTYNLPAMTSSQRWNCALAHATESARKSFPHDNGRVERAYELVKAGKVILHQHDGTATVRSSGDTEDAPTTYKINGVCTCPDAAHRAVDGFCKHKISVVILRKALLLVAEWTPATTPVTVVAQAINLEEVETREPETMTVAHATVETPVQQPDPSVWAQAMADTGQGEPAVGVEAEVIPSTPRIPREFLYDNHGTPAILWGGLLHMAHEAGMCQMHVDVVTVTQEFAVMRATATFNDGGVWTDIGDATPQNVGTKVKASFIRMASTRAQARCLRTALDIPFVVSCEFEDAEDGAE